MWGLLAWLWGSGKAGWCCLVQKTQQVMVPSVKTHSPCLFGTQLHYLENEGVE